MNVRDKGLIDEIDKWPRSVLITFSVVLASLIGYLSTMGIFSIFGSYRGAMFDPLSLAIFAGTATLQNFLIYRFDRKIWRGALIAGVSWYVVFAIISISVGALNSQWPWEAFVIFCPVPLLISIISGLILWLLRVKLNLDRSS